MRNKVACLKPSHPPLRGLLSVLPQTDFGHTAWQTHFLCLKLNAYAAYLWTEM